MTLEEKIETFRHTACEICPAKKVCTKQEDVETCEIYKKAEESTSYAIVYNAGLKDAELSKKYWHEVAREGLPKESGNYLGIDYDHENEPYNFWVDDWEECDFTDLLAWHKIPEYEEQK